MLLQTILGWEKMSQIKCLMPGCDIDATESYKDGWYCLGHYVLVKILDSSDPDYLERFSLPYGPAEFKERCDE